MPLRYHRITPRTLLCAALVALPLVGLTPEARAQTPTCPELSEAQDRYNNGRFEEVIELTTRCLDRPDGSEAERQRAYRLAGLSYIGQDLRDNALEAVRKLIALVPNFEPDPVNDPPQFIEMIDEVKAAEAARLAEEAAQAEEAQPPVDAEAAAGLAEEARRAEAARQAEEARRLEEARRAEDEAARAEAARNQQGGGGITKWLLIGGAVVGGGVLAAVLLGGGGGNGDGGGIPTPPHPPGQ